MSEKMIRALRRRFILISFVSLLGAMLVIGILMYAANYTMTQHSVKNTLDLIVDSKGLLSGARSIHDESDSEEDPSSWNYTVNRFLNEIFNTSDPDASSPEFYYSTRYFAVLYDENGDISQVITNHIAAVTEQEATTYGEAARNSGRSFGRDGMYYYEVAGYDDGTSIVVYLDSEASVKSSGRLFYILLSMIFLGVILVGVFARMLSEKAVQPEIRNVELQKQFITNASHELKTPLSVIRANTEMQEMLGGANEWTASTLRQVDRMNGLIQNLVMISRAQEKQSEQVLSDCSITDAVKETAETFRSVAESERKTMEIHVQEDVVMRAEDASVRQLTSLLVDNAIKYCDEKGCVQVFLSQKGRGKAVTLQVSNNFKDGKDVDYSHFFERFYRADTSHNTDRGGYGIGLSIAEAITEQYRGSIDAAWMNGIITFTCVLRPFLKT
ncbi:MAG: HAMP domain-containing sensor histidine kinase [Firmicutes bacterium]|jgi:two-component system sensor histidine kinase CiaH|nr:HAMP domain-containing sensor histidine kinase [Bacillota bacterium]